jgi:hypothetical protein
MGERLRNILLAGALTVSGCDHIAMQTAVSNITGIPTKIPGKGNRSIRSLSLFYDPNHTHYMMTYETPSDGVHKREVKRDKVGESHYQLKIIEYGPNHSLLRTIKSYISPGERFHKQDITITAPNGTQRKSKHLPKGLSDKIHVTPNIQRR